MGNTTDEHAERADREVEAVWAEMDEFLKGLKAKSAPLTPEQRREQSTRFAEILKRCNDKSWAIFERLETGYSPTH